MSTKTKAIFTVRRTIFSDGGYLSEVSQKSRAVKRAKAIARRISGDKVARSVHDRWLIRIKAHFTNSTRSH